MLQAAISHRFTDGRVADASVLADDLPEVLEALGNILKDWNPTEDEATTIWIMNAKVNGHA